MWKTTNGNAIVSHNGGLQSKDIEFLHSLQEGDRLVIFENGQKSEDRFPDYNLQKSTLEKKD